MNKNILTIAIIFISQILSAQKLRIKKGIAYINDSAFCKVTESKGLFDTDNYTFSILGMDDKELIFVKDTRDSKFYTFYFMNNNEKVRIGKPFNEFDWKASLIKSVFNNNLIVSNKIDSVAKKNFIFKFEYEEPYYTSVNYPNSYPNNYPNNYPNYDRYRIVERNTDAPLFTNNGILKQDGVVIGKFTYTSRIVNNKIIRTYKFRLPNGEIAAELRIEEFKAENNSVYIYKNDITIVVNNLQGLALENEIIEKTVLLLIQKRVI